MKKLISLIEKLILGSKWLLVPAYLSLSLAALPFVYRIGIESVLFLDHFRSLSEAEITLQILGLIDQVMILNLLSMITIGSFHIFVKKFTFLDEAHKIGWLSHVNSNTLKIKMGSSLIGVSSIHLLKDFVSAEHVNTDLIIKHISIHLVFLLSTIALTLCEKWGGQHVPITPSPTSPPEPSPAHH